MTQHRLVVSAVNLIEGGTLTVLRTFLEWAREDLGDEWEIIALVHDHQLIKIPGVQTIAFPEVKRSWFRRIWFEYFRSQALSRELHADLWLAMHDITPRVVARRQAVYCHNPSPFFPITLQEARLDYKLLIFRWLYGMIYRINIHRNSMVIVQQQWLRQEFERRYNARNVVVARPVPHTKHAELSLQHKRGTVFLYPALARPFKNFEVICEAARILENSASWHGEIRLTLDGTENSYARFIRQRYSDCRSIRFIGLQTPAGMKTQYTEADCLLFPSRRETWGLPLTEAKEAGLAILSADLPYAHESIGCYNGVEFFGVDDARELARLILAFHDGNLIFEPHNPPTPSMPYASDWSDLVRLLTQKL